jgi:hypothetical protein
LLTSTSLGLHGRDEERHQRPVLLLLDKARTGYEDAGHGERVEDDDRHEPQVDRQTLLAEAHHLHLDRRLAALEVADRVESGHREYDAVRGVALTADVELERRPIATADCFVEPGGKDESGVQVVRLDLCPQLLGTLENRELDAVHLADGGRDGRSALVDDAQPWLGSEERPERELEQRSERERQDDHVEEDGRART